MTTKLYFPFDKPILFKHFADVKKGGKCSKNLKHLEYYENSLNKYNEFLAKKKHRYEKPLKDLKVPCQIERDERFWISASMMNIYYNPNMTNDLISLLKIAYGSKPPIKDIGEWKDCISGELSLFFEANLPSPDIYKKKWLVENYNKRQFIPYILDCAHDKKILEGPLKADAVFINKDNGFAVLIEAKVLSDISCQITFDSTRNQIARYIDVMIEKNEKLCPPLNSRKPERSLFLLISPKIFKNYPSSRFYGFKFNEYKNSPGSLARDLPYRDNQDWYNISERLGWISWEDINNLNDNYCPWLNE